MKSENPEIIIYGGTFDPPHQGHIDCVLAVMDSFPDARVIILPSIQPAGASEEHKNPIAPFQDRIELCCKAFDVDDRGGNLSVSTLESKLPVPNYTLCTVNEFKKRYPNRRIAFLIGQDQLKVFHLWHKPELILQDSSLIVVKREQNRSITGLLERVMVQLNLEIEWLKEAKIAKIVGMDSAIFLLDTKTSPASSSRIREIIAEGTRVPESWLPKSICDYINSKGFYRIKEKL